LPRRSAGYFLEEKNNPYSLLAMTTAGRPTIKFITRLQQPMFTANEKIILGENENAIEVIVQKSNRARRITIRISGKNGVQLVIPKRVSTEKALKFLYSKEKWIRSKASHIQKPENKGFDIGMQIPILAVLYTICHSGKIRGVSHLDGNNLIISGPEDSTPRKVKKFLHDLAKKEITARVEIETKKLGLKYNRVTLRDTSSRWGSCSTNGNLSFSWRLILAPREALEYVAAHEVAHLLEMNHSKKFWDVVRHLYPNYYAPRKWLKDHGEGLHTYGD
jgi:predicted metal-dependent hydrolase